MKNILTIARVTAHIDIQDQTRNKTYLLPRYQVILHNDDYHEAGYVARSLVKAVPSFSHEHAWEIMLKAHTTGTSLVIICPKEAAEYYQERLQSFGLTITIEPE